jgi:hypothetical protein
MSKLKPRERDSIIQALRAGVVPRHGLRHIQVGRAREIEELVKDIDRIADGGSAIRFIIGEYGSGKTFFMNLIRLIALEKGLVVMFADLAPDRRIYATGGQAQALYAEMAKNLSTRTKSSGGALASVVERFVTNAHREASTNDQHTSNVIREKLGYFEEMAGGYDFSEVIRRYWEAHENSDDELKSAALRWLRGEFSTRTDARKSLAVRTIVDDASVYDHLKLMSAFAKEAGYKGLLVGMDEMVNLFKLSSSKARNSNYEQILRILNDVLQGDAEHLGFLFGGTPEFLMNTRRGLYSYEALQSRLPENKFAKDGLVDLSGPVLRLSNLSAEDLYVLLGNIRQVAHGGDEVLPNSALEAFMQHCFHHVGEAYFRTPRKTVTAFLELIAILDQNPGTDWSDHIQGIEVMEDQGDNLSDIDEATGAKGEQDDDGLVGFKL